MDPREPIGSEWPEVKQINSFAAFYGCLRMATRGLGYLAVTWTTVVLLGGFVSILTKKDFWCLTVITVVQIAGILDASVDRNLWSIGYSAWGVKGIIKVFTRNRLAGTRGSGSALRVVAIIKLLLGRIASLFQWLAYIIILLTYISLVVGDMFILPGLSLWRLIQRDYGTADGDPSKANMTSALDVLYILVVIQGAILVYRHVLFFYVRKKLVAEVAEDYGFKGPTIYLVRAYRRAMISGCYQDPYFARGKNLVTYAVDLMGPDKSPEERGDGLHILSILIGPFSHQQSEKLEGQQGLIRELILHGPSSTYILQHLLLASNFRSQLPPYGSEIEKEVTERATRIVAHVASYMTSLEDLPQVIQCISSMISTFEGFRSHTDQHSDSRKEEKDYYMEMLLQGLHILFELASDQNKCRVINETRGLLPKIMAPLTFDLLHEHEASHDAWGNVVTESLRVMRQLTAAPGETGAKLRHKISINREAISTMTKTLNCDECDKELQSLAMGILTELDMDTKSREYFIKILVDIFTDNNRGSSSRRLAVDALAKLCFQGGSNIATVILQVNGDVVDCLITELVASTRDNIYLISAAAILEHLCIHYTKDDECLKKLKEGMTDVMPKVLNQILPGEATQTGGLFSSSSGDIEGQHHGASQDNGQKKSYYTWQECETDAAVLSLCVTVCDTFISGDQDLALQFDAIDANSFPLKLREMVTRNSDPTVSCLKIVKLTTRMLISMMRHRGTYLKKNLESLAEVLDDACRRNMFLDSSMVFSIGDDDDRTTMTKKPEMTLLSLMQEARELILGYNAEELEVMAPTTSASGEP